MTDDQTELHAARTARRYMKSAVNRISRHKS